MDAVRALRGVQEKLTMLVCDGFKPEELEQSMPISKKNSSLNNSTEILAIEETEKQVNSMLSDLGTMEESTAADSQQEVGHQRVQQRPRITMSPSGFELPPEASDQITTLHKEMEEMKEAVEREANESVEQLEKQKRKKSEEDQHQLKEIEELERQAEEAEERSRTLREEQRKREHEERVDRATRSVSEEVEPEFLASVIDEMAGLTSKISEELDKTGSTASVTDGVEVAMAVPEVAVVAPEESLESAPVTNGDGKSEELVKDTELRIWVIGERPPEPHLKLQPPQPSPSPPVPRERDSALCQEVNDCPDHLMLFRTYVSRNIAGKARAVLEGVGLETSTIDACFSAHPLNDEEVVQAGLVRWRGGQGNKQPPTWEVLISAMEYAGVAQQHVKELKGKLALYVKEPKLVKDTEHRIWVIGKRPPEPQPRPQPPQPSTTPSVPREGDGALCQEVTAEDVLDFFRDSFIKWTDANTVLYELRHRKIISDGDLTKITGNPDPKQQNEILHRCLTRSCDEEALMEVCDLMIAVDGNRRMNTLGQKMKCKLKGN